MCGDLDEEQGASGEEPRLRDAFIARARGLLSASSGVRASDPRHAAMDRIFTDGLSRCLKQTERPSALDLSDQAVVLARLCGLLASHVALAEEPLSQMIEALLAGYSEGREGPGPAAGHSHGHGDDHPH